MATNSWPAVGDNGLTESQWATMYGAEDGIVEDYMVGNVPAADMTRNNTTDQISLRAARVKVNGYYLDIEDGTTASVPPVGSGSATYYVAAMYDPALNVAESGGGRSTLGPCRLVAATTLDTAGGKAYTLLYAITRTAGQVLTAATVVDYRRWCGPTAAMPVKPAGADPTGFAFPRGSTLYETTTGRTYTREVNAAGTALQWRKTDTDWKALPLASGWQAYGGIYQVPQYKIDRGTVKLRGLIRTVAARAAGSHTIATMASIAPEFNSIYFQPSAVAMNTSIVSSHLHSVTASVPTRCDVTSAGVLFANLVGSQTLGAGGWIGLDGIDWDIKEV